MPDSHPKEHFGQLTGKEQTLAIQEASENTHRPPHVLEKDIWVVQTMTTLFDAPFGSSLVLKGGTSLSKAYGLLRRFSEDVDVTYDIRAFVPELVQREGVDDSGYDPIPPSRSQESKWSKIIRHRLDEWIDRDVLPDLHNRMNQAGFEIIHTEAQNQQAYIHYKPLFDGHEFIQPMVKIDFGARSAGVPNTERLIRCDAADSLPAIQLPSARLAAMSPERTFWEKATGVHAYCLQERVAGKRYSRHWHDLVILGQSGYGSNALDDPAFAKGVARHKSMFFRVRAADREMVDYGKAISGHIRLVPGATLRENLKQDYQEMTKSGMLLGDEKPFAQLMDEVDALEKRINACAMAGSDQEPSPDAPGRQAVSTPPEETPQG